MLNLRYAGDMPLPAAPGQHEPPEMQWLAESVMSGNDTYDSANEYAQSEATTKQTARWENSTNTKHFASEWRRPCHLAWLHWRNKGENNFKVLFDILWKATDNRGYALRSNLPRGNAGRAQGPTRRWGEQTAQSPGTSTQRPEIEGTPVIYGPGQNPQNPPTILPSRKLPSLASTGSGGRKSSRDPTDSKASGYDGPERP